MYFNETTLTNETINIEAWTLPGLSYDVIIGRLPENLNSSWLHDEATSRMRP